MLSCWQQCHQSKLMPLLTLTGRLARICWSTNWAALATLLLTRLRSTKTWATNWLKTQLTGQLFQQMVKLTVSSLTTTTCLFHQPAQASRDKLSTLTQTALSSQKELTQTPCSTTLSGLLPTLYKAAVTQLQLLR